eukprot:scaffold20444_cov71-Phaeocystis_antarctica.AAC.2
MPIVTVGMREYPPVIDRKLPQHHACVLRHQRVQEKRCPVAAAATLRRIPPRDISGAPIANVLSVAVHVATGRAAQCGEHVIVWERVHELGGPVLVWQRPPWSKLHRGLRRRRRYFRREPNAAAL